MNLNRFIVCMVILQGCTGPSEVAEAPRFSPVFEYLYKKPMRGESFSSDDSQVLHVSGLPGKQVLYSIGTGPQANDSQIALPPGKLIAYSYFPRSPRILLSVESADMSGDRLYVRSPGSELADVTPAKSARLEIYGWRADSQGFLYGSDRDVREHMYLYSMDSNSLVGSLVLQTQDLRFATASADARYLALVKPLPTMQSEMLYYDRETKKLRRLSALGGGQLLAPQYFEASGDAFVYLSDADSGVVQPRRYLIAEDRSEPLFEDWPFSSVLYARLSAGGSYLVVGEMSGGSEVQPRVLDASTGQPVNLVGFENLRWDIVDISRTEQWMSYRIRDSEGGSLYLYDLKVGSHRQMFPRNSLSKLSER